MVFSTDSYTCFDTNIPRHFKHDGLLKNLIPNQPFYSDLDMVAEYNYNLSVAEWYVYLHTCFYSTMAYLSDRYWGHSKLNNCHATFFFYYNGLIWKFQKPWHLEQHYSTLWEIKDGFLKIHDNGVVFDWKITGINEYYDKIILYGYQKMQNCTYIDFKNINLP
jgi:hypothetical protein